MSASGSEELAAKAQDLLRLHHSAQPLLLPNAWDVASAKAVQAAGFPVLATSSHAVVDVLGEADDDTTDPDLIFDFTARIARAVSVPVSADLEGGYRLPAAELVDRMLAAGVVGCNLEDSDHHGGGVLLDADRHAAQLAEVRAAAQRRGVHIVLNARIDTFIRAVGDPAAQVKEAIRRARLYLKAGADCVYPIAVARREDAAALVRSIPGPVNLLAYPGGIPIGQLGQIGARRISLGGVIFSLVAARQRELLAALAAGADLET
ncbi:MAG: isocitrate lyase/PEP mutase family protein [Solirubrobacteraceae bacterium]